MQKYLAIILPGADLYDQLSVETPVWIIAVRHSHG